MVKLTICLRYYGDFHKILITSGVTFSYVCETSCCDARVTSFDALKQSKGICAHL